MLVPQWRAFRAKAARRARGGTSALLAAATLALGLSSAAQAQVAAEVTAETNLLFRGETISGDNPGLTLALSADHRSGFYAGTDASFASGPEQPRFIASNQYAGFAWRKNKVSLELGVIHRDYWRIQDDAYRPDYFEGFVGISTDRGRLRLYVSPDYLRDGRNTYYGELDARLAKVGDWKINGHIGVTLIPHDLVEVRPGFISYEDWSISSSRRLGAFDLAMSLSATNYPVFGPRGNLRLTATVSHAF